jgi:hypothetical protein
MDQPEFQRERKKRRLARSVPARRPSSSSRVDVAGTKFTTEAFFGCGGGKNPVTMVLPGGGEGLNIRLS